MRVVEMLLSINLKEEMKVGKFKHGDEVEVVDDGYTYTTYDVAARERQISRFGEWVSGKSPEKGKAKVMDLWNHPDRKYECEIAVIQQGEFVFMIGVEGLKPVEKKFGKEDLKSGMVVQYRDGELRLVIEGLGVVSKEGHMQWSNVGFTDKESIHPGCTVVKVYKPNNILGAKLFIQSNDMSGYTLIYDGQKLEAEKQVKELQEKLEAAKNKLAELEG